MGFGLQLLSRSEYDEWAKTIPEGQCPLCEWRTYQYVLHEGTYWLWIACRAPYWKYHTMFIPKRHFQEVSETTVVEMGELIEMYSIGVKKFRELSLELSGKPVNKYMFFWRLRDNAQRTEKDTIILPHFHMHFTPDREGLMDPVLDGDACDWDPSELVI